MPLNLVYSQLGNSITNALLYQLSYSGMNRIRYLALVRCGVVVKCVGYCAYFSLCAVQISAHAQYI